MSSTIKELLISKGFWVLNKEVVKKIGIEPALILSVFSEADDMLADDEGWFYQTAPTIQELTGMTNHKQTKAIEKLIELEILIQENRGLPCKRYFKINYEKVENLVFKKFENCNLKNLKTGIQKISNNKEHNINNIDKEHNNKIDTSVEVSTDQSKVEFKNNFCNYIALVSEATNTELEKVRMTIYPSTFSNLDIIEVLEQIKKSKFLRGELERKPKLTNFSRINMIKKIIAGEYADNEEQQNKITNKIKRNVKESDDELDSLIEELGL